MLPSFENDILTYTDVKSYTSKQKEKNIFFFKSVTDVSCFLRPIYNNQDYEVVLMLV